MPGLVKEAFRLLAAMLFRVCDFLIPKDDRAVIVTFPDGDDQGAALCLELKRRTFRGEIYWLIAGDPESFVRWQQRRGLGHIDIRFQRRLSLQGFWTYLRAGLVFYTHGALFNYAPPRSKLVVNVWHGMPIKKIWRGVPGSTVPLSTYLLSTSRFFSDILMQASGFGPDRLLQTGLPRNDFLLNVRPQVLQSVARLRGNAEKLIFYLPTYRSSARGLKTHDGTETHSLLGLSSTDAQALHAWLVAHNCKLIFKPHPMSVNAGKPFVNDAHWAMLDEQALLHEGLGLYEVLGQADLLVSDVSSVCVDFLITQKAQILYFPDKQRYQDTRGLFLAPLQDYAPGPIASTITDLLTCLDAWRSGEDAWAGMRSRLRDLMIPKQEGSASSNLLAAIGIEREHALVRRRAVPVSPAFPSQPSSAKELP